MNREEFHAKLGPLDRDQLARAMWNLYWRGSAQFRERIEAELDPAEAVRQKRAATQPPDPDMVLAEVTEFTGLARAGAYMYGDRLVTPRERTRWRLTFRRLADEARAPLRAPEPDPAAEALTQLIDLANDTRDGDYFHSEDPVEAAGFVLSDAAALLWEFTRDRLGFAAFADRAAPLLIRWESRYGWTRSGYGKTSEKETSLAQVLASMLRTPDMWTGFAERYLAALDQLASTERRSPASRRDHDIYSSGGSTYARDHRADCLIWRVMFLPVPHGRPLMPNWERWAGACVCAEWHAHSGLAQRARRSGPAQGADRCAGGRSAQTRHRQATARTGGARSHGRSMGFVVKSLARRYCRRSMKPKGSQFPSADHFSVAIGRECLTPKVGRETVSPAEHLAGAGLVRPAPSEPRARVKGHE